MEDKPTVSVVIINWKGWQDTRQCFESLLESDYNCLKVILVDNESDENKLQEFINWAKDIFDRITLMPMGGSNGVHMKRDEKRNGLQDPSNGLTIFALNENVGFAKGCNRGIRYALQEGSRFVFLLNNDTVLEKETIGKLVAFSRKNPAFPLLTPQIRYFDTPEKVWNCGGKLLWPGIRRYYYGGKNQHVVPSTGYKKITFVTGCALFFDPHQVGLLSENFFFGEEDFELSMRLKRRKIPMACVYDAVVFHKVARSIARSHSRILNRINLHYLNRLVNLKSFYPWITWPLIAFFQLVYMVPMVRIKHKVPVKKIFAMVCSLIRESWALKEVNKTTFDRIRERIY